MVQGPTGSNNARDGNTGTYFVDTDVLTDFKPRLINDRTMYNKQLLTHYYKKVHDKSCLHGLVDGRSPGSVRKVSRDSAHASD